MSGYEIYQFIIQNFPKSEYDQSYIEDEEFGDRFESYQHFKQIQWGIINSLTPTQLLFGITLKHMIENENFLSLNYGNYSEIKSGVGFYYWDPNKIIFLRSP